MPSRSRASIACRPCRERKVKCSGGQPCDKCASAGSDCSYPASQRRRREKHGQVAGGEVERRLARMESLLQRRGYERDPSPPAPPRTPPFAPSPPSTANLPGHNTHSRGVSSGSGVWLSQSAQATDEAAQAAQLPSAGTPTLPPSDTLSHSALPPLAQSPSRPTTPPLPPTSHENSNAVDEEENVIPLKSDNCWEHHGPGAWVSICSEPGLKWVCARTGSADFIQSARGLIRNWTQRLRFKENRTRNNRVREPDEATAWTYCTAYFEECYEAGFGVVHRLTFEDLLKKHFQRGAEAAETEEDPCWYALRNVVYATGCRKILAQDPSASFTHAQAQAWGFFENALSVLRDLVFFPTGLTGVQALALMTTYSEGLGSPALEYMLSSNAVRAAQSKGLHRQPSRSWGLPACEILHRNWLFWAIYCSDKQVAFRSGRPSAIDDDNISAHLPHSAPTGSTADVEIFRAIVKLAQICSQISKRLMSVKAFQQPASDFLASVVDLHTQLEQFHESLSVDWRPGTPITPSQHGLSSPRLIQIIYLHFAYYGSLIATHVLLTYPWMSGRFREDSSLSFWRQQNLSSATVADAARNIIMNTRALKVDAATPAFLAFYYPILSHITLFIHVLKYSSLSTTDSDIALLDTCAGHFGFMEYITSSEFSFPFVRESATLARATIKRAREIQSERTTVGIQNGASNGMWSGESTQMGQRGPDASDSSFMQTPHMSDALWDETMGLESVDFDLESRNLFAIDGDPLSDNRFDFF